ncbi:MAG TPA: 5,10-methylene tetrahydromethanopterin reductase, partial [Acidimicrobiia bacterium]|nr:5,10-methylene tetrahydromethanopterin reductase [Acidimicrobiia bacterium]
PAGFVPARPIDVPILVAANGPRGLQVAKQLGDGVMTIGSGQPEFDWCAVLAFGTVLDEGEPPTSPRALEAAGPALTVVYHGMYEADPAAVDSLPGGPEWRAEVEGVPESVRHLTVHEDHLVRVTERDAPLLDGHTLAAFTWTGTRNQLRGRLDELEAAGATEILYAPMGPDISRELRAFAAMAGLA